MKILKILCTSMMFMGTFGVLHENGMLTITVIYESYCKHTIKFITQQLVPMWERLGDYVEVEFVPFGLARTAPNGTLICDRGPAECNANRLHACAIDVACGGKSSICCPNNQLAKAMAYIKCLMQNKDQNEASLQCSKKAGLNPQDINTCIMARSDNLVHHYMDFRGFFNYEIGGSPFILVDGVKGNVSEALLYEQLDKFVCRRLQEECSYYVCEELHI